MSKPRKPPVTNDEVIKRLIEGGHWQTSTLDGTSEYSKIWKRYNRWEIWHNGHDEKQEMSFMIPADLYKSLGFRFAVQFPINTVVRLRSHSTRKFERKPTSSDLGDTKQWGHLGIGSGKMYLGNRALRLLKEVEGINTDLVHIRDEDLEAAGYREWLKRHVMTQLKEHFRKQIVIGNRKFPVNLIASLERAQYYLERGITRKWKPSWLPKDANYRETKFNARDFLEYKHIVPNGAFEPKKLINGQIVQVYVHFLYPKWKKKRESRYEVLFENGASGIFTNDYLEKVFDTDYDFDESLYYCTGSDQCDQALCKHWSYHSYIPYECEEMCGGGLTHKAKEHKCIEYYNMEKLMDSTHAKGLEYVQDK